MSERLILLAEDEETDVFFFERALELCGAPVQMVRVSDGAEALAYLKDPAKSAQFSLVVLDLVMPRLTALEVLERLKELKVPVRPPIIVVSSEARATDVAQAQKLGAQEFVLKPAGFENLTEVVRRLVETYVRK